MENIKKIVDSVGDILTDASQYVNIKGLDKNIVKEYINELNDLLMEFFNLVKTKSNVNAFKNDAITKIFKFFSNIQTNIKNENLFLSNIEEMFDEYKTIKKVLK